MSAADASSLSLWSAISLLGLILVIIGVVMEGAEATIWTIAWLRRKRLSIIWNTIPEPHIPRWAHRLDHWGWFILVIGLALETWGHIRVTDITGRENQRLTKKLDSTTQIAGAAIESASTNEVVAKQLEIQLNATKMELVNAEIKLTRIKNAIPERLIPEKQRELFIATLLNTNILSPKIDIKVFVQDVDDPEAKRFADSVRKMLNDAEYGTNGEEVIKIKPFNVAPSTGEKNERMPQIFAVFAKDNNGNKIPLSMPSLGGCIATFIPTKITVQSEIGNPQIPTVNYYSTYPNDILGGVRNILNYIELSTVELSVTNLLLKPYEVGLYIPPQAE